MEQSFRTVSVETKKRKMSTEQDIMTEPTLAGPEKKVKKSSVKVVRRVKSKKSEKAPEIGPGPTEEVALATESPTPARPSDEKPVRAASSRRRGSNVFAMFTQNQVSLFKEVFSFIDQDKDGIISKGDIRATFDALGRLVSERELDEMAREAPGPINFTTFLSVFGQRIDGTDDEEVVQHAFQLYDEGDGSCQEDKLRHALMTWGDKFSATECETLLQEAPVDSRGRIDVRRFASLVTRGADDDNDQNDDRQA